MEYHKINGLFKRWQKDLHTPDMLPEGKKFGDFKDWEFAQAEFEFLQNNEWIWKEKLDGTNIRIYLEMLDDGNVAFEIKGRTSRANIPVNLETWIRDWVSKTDFNMAFGELSVGSEVVLYGEGVGSKIQKGGGNYGPQHFKLFDILIGNYWLEASAVEDIATALNLTNAPVVLKGTIAEAIEYVKKEPNSAFGEFMSEGLVGCPSVRLNDARGHRIITKVKVKDFK